MPIFNYRRENLISRHVHCPLDQAVFTCKSCYFLLFLLGKLIATIFFLLSCGCLLSCQLFCCLPRLKNLWGRLWLPDLHIELQDILINLRHWVPFSNLNWKVYWCWHESMLGFVLCHKDFMRWDTTTRLQWTAHPRYRVHVRVHCFLDVKDFSASVDVEV